MRYPTKIGIKGLACLLGLAYLDTAGGLKPIVEKLPYSLQERWITEGFRYNEEYNVPFPPFTICSRFVRC